MANISFVDTFEMADLDVGGGGGGGEGVLADAPFFLLQILTPGFKKKSYVQALSLTLTMNLAKTGGVHTPHDPLYLIYLYICEQE